MQGSNLKCQEKTFFLYSAVASARADTYRVRSEGYSPTKKQLMLSGSLPCVPRKACISSKKKKQVIYIKLEEFQIKKQSWNIKILSLVIIFSLGTSGGL